MRVSLALLALLSAVALASGASLSIHTQVWAWPAGAPKTWWRGDADLLPQPLAPPAPAS